MQLFENEPPFALHETVAGASADRAINVRKRRRVVVLVLVHQGPPVVGCGDFGRGLDGGVEVLPRPDGIVLRAEPGLSALQQGAGIPGIELQGGVIVSQGGVVLTKLIASVAPRDQGRDVVGVELQRRLRVVQGLLILALHEHGVASGGVGARQDG